MNEWDMKVTSKHASLACTHFFKTQNKSNEIRFDRYHHKNKTNALDAWFCSFVTAILSSWRTDYVVGHSPFECIHLKICAILPSHNHYSALPAILPEIQAHITDIFIIDDGSDEPERHRGRIQANRIRFGPVAWTANYHRPGPPWCPRTPRGILA